jgi:hypothetical protein
MTASICREYEEERELYRYIWRNYGHALTQREHALHRAAIIELKAQSAPGYRHLPIPGRFYDDEVAAIVRCGLDRYEKQCCERLLRDHSTEIYINRCDRCDHIVVSPVACICLWCGHRWYERRSEMVARSASSIYPRSNHQSG